MAEAALKTDLLQDDVAEMVVNAQEAADFAEASPQPGPEALYRNVWADVNPNGRLFFDGRDRYLWPSSRTVRRATKPFAKRWSAIRTSS